MPYFDWKCEVCGAVYEHLTFKNAGHTCHQCHAPFDKQTKLAAATNALRLYGPGFSKRTHKDTGDWGG